MSSPTPGSDPDHPEASAPQAQPGWEAPAPQPQGQPSWDAPAPPQEQAYGAPAASYPGAPAGYGSDVAAARPPQVLTAAILGFAEALLLLLAALAYFAFASIVGFLALFGILYLALAAGNIWGGIMAIQGKASRILVISAGISAALALIGIIIAAAGGAGFDTFSLLVLVLGAAIVALLYQPPSKQYFAARGAR